MVTRRIRRVQEIVLPYLRAEFPGVAFYTWYPDTAQRSFPFVTVKRLGGSGSPASARRPDLLDLANIELAAYGKESLADTEDLLLDVRKAIWDMVDQQVVTPAGYLHSYFEVMPPQIFDSPFEDSWRIQGIYQLGVRPPRNPS